MTTAQLQEAARLTTLAYLGKGMLSDHDTKHVLIPAFLKDLAKESPNYETMDALVCGIVEGIESFITRKK